MARESLNYARGYLAPPYPIESAYMPRQDVDTSHTSYASTLKVWIVANLGANKAGIECPHCGGKAVVNKRRWMRDNGFIGRSCTYCFKTGRLPGKHGEKRHGMAS